VSFTFCDQLSHTNPLNASISTPAMQPIMLNPTTPPDPNPRLVALSSFSGAGTESAADTSLSKPPQRSAAMRAAERLAQVAEDSPIDDTPKKKTPAAFQLNKVIIPDDAGHIKVSST